MDHGVVVLEGEKPADGTVVDVVPAADATVPAVATHPAIGMWKDRTDLPDDSVEAEVRRDVEKIVKETLTKAMTRIACWPVGRPYGTPLSWPPRARHLRGGESMTRPTRSRIG